MAAKMQVFTRAGHTEATVDLCRLAGLYPACALSEVMHDNGKMMRRDDLEVLTIIIQIFSKEHNIKIISIASLKEYMAKNGKQCIIHVHFLNYVNQVLFLFFIKTDKTIKN